MNGSDRADLVAEHEEVFPSIVILAKALAEGHLPLAITLTTEENKAVVSCAKNRV